MTAVLCGAFTSPKSRVFARGLPLGEVSELIRPKGNGPGLPRQPEISERSVPCLRASEAQL